MQEIVKALPVPPRAIVWTGGFVRGEATYVEDTLLNDIDFFVIGSFLPALMPAKRLEEWKEVAGQKVKISISIGTPSQLKTNKTLAGLEIASGVTVYGDSSLGKMAVGSREEVDKLEGVRLLFTRLNALQDANRSDLELKYLSAKTFLACEQAYAILKKKPPENLQSAAHQAREFKASRVSDFSFSVEQSKKTLLETIEYYIKQIESEGSSPVQKLAILSRRKKSKYGFNFYYFWRIRSRFSPKFFSVVFSFNVINLYYILFLYDQGKAESAQAELNKFFQNASPKDIPELLSLYPLPAASGLNA